MKQRKQLSPHEIIARYKKGERDFSNIDCTGDFIGIDLSGINFKGSKLEYAGFEESNLTEANFTDCNLQWSSFRHANLTKTNFKGADLSYSILMIVGTFFITLGWVTLYRNIKKQSFVTSGIYAYSRHPQYLGFIFIILGWFIGWPTILTVFFAPILVYKYIRLCRTEEKEISKKSPEYRKYIGKVPFFI